MSIYSTRNKPTLAALSDTDELWAIEGDNKPVSMVAASTAKTYMNNGVVAVTTTPLTAAVGTHDSRVTTLSRAAGITVTLPAASGTGNKYTFVVITTTTSNGYIIKVDSASATMTGSALLAQDSADTTVHFETGADTDTITLNGTTTGGIKGDMVELIDIASNLWFVRVVGSATSTEATPFSATVS